jgi:hypothetical protein
MVNNPLTFARVAWLPGSARGGRHRPGKIATRPPGDGLALEAGAASDAKTKIFPRRTFDRRHAVPLAETFVRNGSTAPG